LLFSKNKQVEENKELDSSDQTSEEDTYSIQNKPAHNSPVEITMPGTDHHSKGQPEINESKETDKAKKRRNRRNQQKAAQNQRAQLSTTENSPTNIDLAENKLLQDISSNENSVSQKQPGQDTSAEAMPEEPSPQQCSPTLTVPDQRILTHNPHRKSPKIPSTDHTSPEEPSTKGPSTEHPSPKQPSLEDPSAEDEMQWVLVVGRRQKKHTKDATKSGQNCADQNTPSKPRLAENHPAKKTLFAHSSAKTSAKTCPAKISSTVGAGGLNPARKTQEEQQALKTKEGEPVRVVSRCHKCCITHWPCDCPAVFWNCHYCGEVGHSYYVCDKIR